MPDPRDLTSLANLQAWLNLSPTTDTDLLGRLITASSLFIQSSLDRTIAEAAYTEVRDGTGGRVLALAVTPVASVDSVTIDGRPVPSAMDVTTPGYLFSATRVALIGRRFCKGLGNVTVSYTAGYAETPPDIEQACLALAGQRYRERDRIGLSAKGLAGETTQFAVRDMPPDVATVLAQYRKVIPV
jgi:hypothetical protein